MLKFRFAKIIFKLQSFFIIPQYWKPFPFLERIFARVLIKLNYRAEIHRFITSQNIYSAVRIALAIVIPAMILAHYGLLKEYFLFPLGTSFVGLTDMPGTYHRRRNALILAIITFSLTALTASLLKDWEVMKFAEIVIFGLFFSLIGVYGQRFAAVGGLTLVVLAVFLDGHLSEGALIKNLVIFFLGCLWFLVIFIIVTKLQPYKLASQLIGENYAELAEYLKIKAKFYESDADFESLYKLVIAKQVIIKNLQEETREVVFKTRQIVNESTTTSRLLMLMFLNSVDLFEKMMTADQDYKKLHQNFEDSEILKKISEHLLLLADEIKHIGINIQSGGKGTALSDFRTELGALHNEYFSLRNREMRAENLEDFMSLRLVMTRITEFSDDIHAIYLIFSQDTKLAKTLSTGLDYEKFLPSEEPLNFKVLFSNISLKSAHFRHAVRITLALLIAYSVSKLEFLNINRSYWILITIVAIMRPAFSTTKYRNLLRLYGTVAGAIVSYFILLYVNSSSALFAILCVSMILCFSFLKNAYAYAVFFMTVYIFITFNFIYPVNIDLLFKERLIDTLIAGIIAFLVSYFVLPVWEHTQNISLMKMSAESNLKYFTVVIEKLRDHQNSINYKIVRKDAIINLANLSDNFQRMLSDPKNQQQKLEYIHQFVNTSHLITAYTASLSLYGNSKKDFSTIDLKNWHAKIGAEFFITISILNEHDENLSDAKQLAKIRPEDEVDVLIEKRKSEIEEFEFYDRRDQRNMSQLTELKNIHDLFILLSDVVHEQRKVAEKLKNL